MTDLELVKLFVNKMLESCKEQKTDFERGLYMGYEGVRNFIESLDNFLYKKKVEKDKYHIYVLRDNIWEDFETIEGSEIEAIKKAEFLHKRAEWLNERNTVYKVYRELENGSIDFDNIVHITEGI